MLRVINWCIQLGIVLVCLQFRAEAFGQCSSIIDLNAWTEQGPPANGTWNVNPTGTTVTQTINSFPTFFVSPQEFINVRITGTLQSTGTDDDFIGFAIGYRNPLGGTGSVYPVETWLFDWKRGTQTVGGNTVQLGQYLSQINGNFDLTVHSAEFWGHQSQNGFNVVASNTGPGTAWAVNAVYNFELTYLSSRLVIAINSDTIFDVPGCFEPGRFGFYNYSQGGTVYANFAYELIPDFTMNTFSVCLGDSAEFQYVSDTCSSSLLTNSVVGNWRWDFGDGDTSALASPAHLYDTLGTYDVTLVVTDNFGCQDSVTRPVTVNTCALPVSYHYFEVRAEGPAARLEWETFSEVGNRGYEIQRSADGQDFAAVGWVPASESATGSRAYHFRDPEVQRGLTCFYRLDQIDQEGRVNRSEVRQFTLPRGSASGIEAFPNPTPDVVTLRVVRPVDLPPDAVLQVEVLNPAGIRQAVAVQAATDRQGGVLALDLGDLPAGMYLAEVRWGERYRRTVRIQRRGE